VLWLGRGGGVGSMVIQVTVHAIFIYNLHLSGRGTTRAEDVQGTPTQSHISPSILVYEDNLLKV